MRIISNVLWMKWIILRSILLHARPMMRFSQNCGGQSIREARKARNISQAVPAEKIGFAPRTSATTAPMPHSPAGRAGGRMGHGEMRVYPTIFKFLHCDQVPFSSFGGCLRSGGLFVPHSAGSPHSAGHAPPLIPPPGSLYALCGMIAMAGFLRFIDKKTGQAVIAAADRAGTVCF